MKLSIVTTVLALALTGCASTAPVAVPENLTHRLYNSEEINSTYCDMEGFTKFYESNRHYSFQCSNGSKFRIPK